MAEQTVEVGNAIILLTCSNDPFSDGHTTGYLEFYDERHRPAFPLTSHTVRDHLLAIMHEPSMPSLWKAGRITGWMEALMENAHRRSRAWFQRNGSPLCKPCILKNRFVRAGERAISVLVPLMRVNGV